MSGILNLDENEIRQYKKLDSTGGIGQQAEDAMFYYKSRLNLVSGEGFMDDDTSTAHAVIDELVVQTKEISEVIDSVDSMIDNLVYLL